MVRASYLMQLIKLWFLVSRPALYPLMPLLFILGYQAGGGSMTVMSTSVWIFVLALTWPLSMIIYGINDLYDIECDTQDAERTKRSGFDIANSKNKQRVWWGIALAFCLLVVVGYMSFEVAGVLFAVVALAVSVMYSVPPFRLKTRPIWDVVFSGFVYGYCLYGFGYYVMSYSYPPKEAILLSLVAMCVHAIGAIRDFYVDKATNNKTIAVLLGFRTTSFFVLILCSVIATTWFLYRGLSLSELLLFSVIFVPMLLVLINDNPNYIRKFQWLFVLILLLVGIIKVFIE